MKISLYLDSGSGRFLLVNKDTKAREVVMLSLKEFGITECSTNFALVEVSPAHPHTCIHAHLHTRTHAHMHTCTHAHLHTCTPAHLPRCWWITVS